ncbi:Hypothetical predicted protein [Pelobates cultripes]|uniref:Uncharacterized protein n=1 Tax=Pelobates cultripes TaxID=61616 RepID=A0AAD1SPM2_PELCU|nr:Hypothetical predicted protein [Pelobates cultripes]
MGRTKRPDGSQTPRAHPSSSQTGPMDGYLAPSTAGLHEAAGANMADSPTRSLTSEQAEPSLADISADIRALAAAMVTKEDMRALSDTLHAAIRTEVTSLRAEITTQANRMQAAESTVQAMGDRLEASNTAIHRQGNILLQLRRGHRLDPGADRPEARAPNSGPAAQKKRQHAKAPTDPQAIGAHGPGGVRIGIPPTPARQEGQTTTRAPYPSLQTLAETRVTSYTAEHR